MPNETSNKGTRRARLDTEAIARREAAGTTHDVEQDRGRPIRVRREHDELIVSMRWDAELVRAVRAVPWARFDRERRVWCVPLTTAAIKLIRRWRHSGLTDADVEAWVDDATSSDVAELSAHTNAARPWKIACAVADDDLYARLREISGARFVPASRSFTYPSSAWPALRALVAEGVVVDPDDVLGGADTIVHYDFDTGDFDVVGDERAAAAFTAAFPQRDVMAVWRDAGLSVAFSCAFTEEVYRGELARAGQGLRPAALRKELSDDQAVTVAVAHEREGLVVASEPGAGKTAAAIACGVAALDAGEVTRVVIIAPSSLTGHWGEQITEWAGDMSIVVSGGPDGRREKWGYARGSRWLVASYDVLDRDGDAAVAAARGALVICDEAHQLRNPATLRHRSTTALLNVAKRRLLLTGTPVVGDAGDIGVIVGRLAVPGVFGTASEFNRRYRWKGDFGGVSGAKNLDELAKRAAPHLVRLGSPAGELEHHIETISDPATAELCELAADAAVGTDGAGSGIVRSGLERLLCLSPRLCVDEHSAAAQALVDSGARCDIDGGKLEWLVEHVGEYVAASEKVLIFSSSARFAQLCVERLISHGVPAAGYWGEMTQKARREVAGRFREGEVMVLCATDAASEGIGLDAECDLVVMADLPWTAARWRQRAARIRRLNSSGATKVVISLVYEGLAEQRVVDALVRRDAIAAAVLDEDTEALFGTD